MGKFILIRHGEPDYSYVDKNNYSGFGHELAKLKEDKESTIIELSENKELKNADLIITSPYTRTMQTACILSRALNLKVIVEEDLMEWRADINFKYNGYDDIKKAKEEYEKNNGIHNKSDQYNWEEKRSLRERAEKVLFRYKNYNKIIVVAHGILIKALTNTNNIDYGKFIILNK